MRNDALVPTDVELTTDGELLSRIKGVVLLFALLYERSLRFNGADLTL